jgi:hypothetical protein
LTILALSASVIPLQAEQRDKITEIMHVTGLDTCFDSFGPALTIGMKQNIGKLSGDTFYREKVLGALEPAAATAFAPEKLRSQLRALLAEKLNAADFGPIAAFYNGPIGARITAMENARNTPDAQAKMRASASELAELLKKQPERAKVLMDLDSSLRLTENSVDLAFNIGRATAVGMAAANEKTTTLSGDAVAAIDSALEKVRPGMAEKMKPAVLLSLAYTYRDASIEDLRKYLKFLTSPVGKRFYDAVTPALSQVLVKAGDEFGHDLMKELGKERA